MESAAGAAQAPLAAKRQRTDDGPATDIPGGANANGHSNGSHKEDRDHQGQSRGSRNQQKRGGGRDQRVGLIHQAIKRNNLKFAMETFREAIADGLSVPTTLVNSMMYVACGGEQWERYVRGLPPLTGAEAAAAAATAAAEGANGEGGNGMGGGAEAEADGEAMAEARPQQQQQQERQQQQQQKGKRKAPPSVPHPEGPPPTREELVAAVDELWSYMSTAGLAPDSGTYLGLARRDAIRGNRDEALSWAHKCFKSGKPVQLRLFHPAQVGYSMAADVESLMRVDALIASHRLDNTEYEYARLLEGIAAAGTYEQLRGVLMRMQSDLNQVSPATAGYIAAFFENSSAALQAFAPVAQGGCPGFAAVLSREAAATTPAAAALEPAVATEAAAPAPPAAETEPVAAAEAAQAEAAPAAEAEAAMEVEQSAAAAVQEAVTAAAAPVAAAEAAATPSASDAVRAEVDAPVADVTTAEAPAAEAAPAAAASSAVAAPTATAGEWRWRVLRGVAVEASGRCEAAGGSLRVIDLEDEEWDAFAKAVADLARNNMGDRAADFDGFVEWYGRNGPYDILVDAANVAFFGQNYEGGGFDWDQIRDMYEMLRKRFPKKKILVMLHRKRLNTPEARSHYVQDFLEKLRRCKSFYYTPPGANDDWFWLYACVCAKHDGMLVSNDELRDHIFSLLRPKHFLKWKERHIAHYAHNSTLTLAELDRVPAGSGRYFELHMPRPYTACVQQLAETGAWMVPLSDGTWVCVRPERVDVGAQGQ